MTPISGKVLTGKDQVFAHLILTLCLAVPLGVGVWIFAKPTQPVWLAAVTGILSGVAAAVVCLWLLRRDSRRSRLLHRTTAIVMALLSVLFLALGVVLLWVGSTIGFLLCLVIASWPAIEAVSFWRSRQRPSLRDE